MMRPGLGFGAAITVLALLGGAMTASMSLQVVLTCCVVVLAVATGGPRSWLLAAAIVSFSSGLVRRMIAGPSGRIDNDPLVILPLALLALVVVFAVLSRRRDLKVDRLTVVLVAIPASEVLAVLATGRVDTASLYELAAQTVPWLVVAGVRAGAVPDVWPTLVRWTPWVAAVVGGYGVLQFVVLPEWDRRWLVGLQAASFGAAEPFKVRVWGMSDSPGPYAALLGCCIVVMAHRAIRGRAREQFLWLAASLATVVPLVLTGVRLALLGLALCVLLVSAASARGARRVVPLLVVAGAVAVVSTVVGAFGGSSTILTADRLTAFNPSTDNSVQTRLSLFRLLPSAASHPFGSSQGKTADSFFADVLLSYGPLSAGLVVFALLALLVAAARQLRTNPGSSAPVALVFLLVFSLGGSVLVSSSGTLVALVMGAVAAGTGSARDALVVSFERGLAPGVTPYPIKPAAVMSSRSGRRPRVG